MVQACTIIKISVHIWCRKTVILEISECEKRVFWQSVASDHSRNVNGNELVNFNLVQKKIIHFIKKILEVKASVIITDGTICTTAFVTYSQIQYNSTILFNYCMVLYCTHRSLDSHSTWNSALKYSTAHSTALFVLCCAVGYKVPLCCVFYVKMGVQSTQQIKTHPVYLIR